MFKSGSKFLFGLAGVGFISAILYAMATSGERLDRPDSLLGPLTLGYKGYVGDHVGFTILVGLSFVSLFLGIFIASLRDADPEAGAQAIGLETVPEVPVVDTVNYWPIIGAFSAAALVLGLAVGETLVVIGAVGLVATLVEWAARAWADRATGDAEVNQSIRDRFLGPIEIPVLALLGIGGMALAISRIMLALPKVSGYIVFGLVPTIILILGFAIIARPKVSQSAIVAILLIGGFAILAGGVIAAIAGPRGHEGGHEEGLAPQYSQSIPVVVVVD